MESGGISGFGKQEKGKKIKEKKVIDIRAKKRKLLIREQRAKIECSMERKA